MKKLSHTNRRGEARMVDVSAKKVTQRKAVARARVRMKRATLRLIRENLLAKGDVLNVARIAGVMAAKRTPSLIPLCHPLPLATVAVDFTLCGEGLLEITAEARVTGRTGVEMEAMTAAAVAALTVYDMCKSVDRGMAIEEICLLQKSGGKSGTYRRRA